ncbi:hypothetical protein BM525_18835 (plasmid) [Alteromonas mediterranea]|uniref:Lipoprotein n=1 Tax=Alteromonas mediterranea TaxID=314275 RepID=A0AAC9NTM7_9ALTE|nr:hypothetical protein [Alteromonas mediterranea]APD91939.1 hypothetical protein BM524_18640 [Alteromonas mediterranea]APD99793.1 hypothetical protein BM525_18835 [Alteromonas mediterranea]
MNISKGKITLAVAAALLMGGCSSSHSPEVAKAIAEHEKAFEGGYDEQVKKIKPYRHEIGREHSNIRFLDVNDYEIIAEDERRLPSQFNLPATIKDNADSEKTIFTLDSFAAMIYQTSGIVLDVSSPDLQVLAKNNKEDQNGLGNADGLGLPTPQLQGVRNDSAQQYDQAQQLLGVQTNANNDRDGLKLKHFEYSGDLRGLLDYVSILNGIKWKYDEDAKRAFMYAYDTESFFIHDFSDDMQLDSEVTTETQQDTESTNGGSSKEMARTATLNSWDNIKEDITNMLSKDTGRAGFDRKYGQVTVTDSDFVLNRVKKYVQKKNDAFGKEITLDIRFIQFSYTEGDNKSISQNYLNDRLQNNILGSFDLEFGTGALSPNIGSNLGTLQEMMSGNFLTLATESQEILLGMLNSIGTAKTSFKSQVEVLNNDSISDQKVINQEYIDSIERSNYGDENSNESITTEKGVAVDGFNLTARPRIAGDEIILNYTINSADFLNLDDAGLGNGLEGVSLKRDGSAVIDQTVKLKNGIPKIVKFTHQDDETVDSQGLFDHAFWFLGGNEDLSKNKNATIVTITAYYNN